MSCLLTLKPPGWLTLVASAATFESYEALLRLRYFLGEIRDCSFKTSLLLNLYIAPVVAHLQNLKNPLPFRGKLLPARKTLLCSFACVVPPGVD